MNKYVKWGLYIGGAVALFFVGKWAYNKFATPKAPEPAMAGSTNQTDRPIQQTPSSTDTMSGGDVLSSDGVFKR